MLIYNKLSDQELTVLLKKGDQAAYTEIFEKYKIILYKYAFRMLGDSDEVNDIIQDVFLALWQKRNDINLKTSLSAYLYSAVRNRIFDLISHQKVIVRYLDSKRNYIEQGQCITDEQIRGKELAHIIEKEVAALPNKMRNIFELSREDLSYKEIGESLNISDKSVKQQVYNAVKILRLKINSILIIFSFL